MPSYLSSTQSGGLMPGQRLCLVGDRRGQHRLERMEEGQARALERVAAGQQGRPPDVSAEHAGPLHGGQVTLEGGRDGGLQVALTQADAQLAAEDGHEVAGRERVGTPQQPGHDLALGFAAAGRSEGLVAGRDLDQGQRRLVRRGLVAGLGEELADGRAQVGGAVVGRPQGAIIGAGHRLHDGRDGHPAEPGRALLAFREGATAQEDSRYREVGIVQRAQVSGRDGRPSRDVLRVARTCSAVSAQRRMAPPPPSLPLPMPSLPMPLSLPMPPS